MENLFSKKEFLSNLQNETVLVQKGQYDLLFSFISEYLYLLFSTGCVLDDETGIGGISVPETKAMKLFYSFYVVSSMGYSPEVMKIIIETEFFKIISTHDMTELELEELVMMKHLVINAHHMHNGIDNIISLASAFCGHETRSKVIHLLTKILNKYI